MTVFLFVPPSHQNDLLTGWRGLVLMGCTIMAVAALAFIPQPGQLGALLADWFGRLSYPIYLLHPIAYWGIAAKLSQDDATRIAITLAATTVLSVAVHQLIERPILSRRLQ